MTFALISSATPAGGSSGGTTAAIDTSGANLIVLAVTHYDPLGVPTVFDSNSNTWTALTPYLASSGGGVITPYYCYGPIVGSGHTFSVSGGTHFSAVGPAAFSGAASSPFDAQTGNGNSFSTTQPGSITPSVNDALLFSATNWNPDGSITIDSGFNSPPTQLAPGSGQNFGTGFAYLIQTSAAAVNPTVTNTASSPLVATTLVAFKPSIGGGGSTFGPIIKGGTLTRGLVRGGRLVA